MSVGVYAMCGHACRGQKETSDPEDLELQLVMSELLDVGDGLHTWIQLSYLDWKLKFVVFIRAEGSTRMSYQINLSS